jgi:transposase
LSAFGDRPGSIAIKRRMYGRAGLNLLERRFLPTA